MAGPVVYPTPITLTNAADTPQEHIDYHNAEVAAIKAIEDDIGQPNGIATTDSSNTVVQAPAPHTHPGGGLTIYDSTGTALPPETALQVFGLTVVDNSTTHRTELRNATNPVQTYWVPVAGEAFTDTFANSSALTHLTYDGDTDGAKYDFEFVFAVTSNLQDFVGISFGFPGTGIVVDWDAHGHQTTATSETGNNKDISITVATAGAQTFGGFPSGGGLAHIFGRGSLWVPAGISGTVAVKVGRGATGNSSSFANKLSFGSKVTMALVA